MRRTLGATWHADCSPGLSGSLVFCLSKAKIAVEGLQTQVKTQLVRNERNRLRIGKPAVTLHPKLAKDSPDFARCREVFEDFCVVTESVRSGIEVDVAVELDEVPSEAAQSHRTLTGEAANGFR